MCRIDEPFGSLSLEEKSDPTERFIQALDEYGAKDSFRELLEKHFSISWPRELGKIEAIEAALKSARQVSTPQEKISSFVQVIKGPLFSGRFEIFCPAPVLTVLQKSCPDRFAFARDVADVFYPDSPFGFYQCFKDEGLFSFELFVLSIASTYYGDTCHLSPLLFNDGQIEALGKNSRETLLWRIFEHLAHGQSFFVENLLNTFSWENHSNKPTLNTVNGSFDYLSAWIKSDVQSRGYSEILGLINGRIGDFLGSQQSNISKPQKFLPNEDWTEDKVKKFSKWADKWLVDRRQELTKTLCLSAKIESIPQEDFDNWAWHSHEACLPLYPGLSEEQAEALIAWGIKDDLQKWLTEEQFPSDALTVGPNSILWYVSPRRDIWRKHLLITLENLPFCDRLKVLKRRLGFRLQIFKLRLPSFVEFPQQKLKVDETNGEICEWYEFLVEQKDLDWWDSLLRKLSEENSFPKELYPSWVDEIRTRFGFDETLVPLADKSLGIIRGDLVAGNNKMSGEQVGRLLKVLEKYAPEKAVRHRLMLLRASRRPFAKETLDIDRESLCALSMTEILKEFWAEHTDHSRRQYSHDEWADEEVQFLSDFRMWFSFYCLSRLRLRKGEKPGNSSYSADQVVEKSSIWRQAYLKALAEIGMDLQGKVHRTVYFTREFDPDEAVRSVAKECYKAVRREKNKSQSAADIRRGLTAAYWWLLLAQRQELGLSINYEEARLTRRRLLRR